RSRAGVSRSVAVVTAYLMKTEGLRWEEAYAAVRAAKPEAEVNPGFQEQLKLYEAMGCAVDSSSGLYKRYRLQVLAERHPELQDLPREVFAVDPTSTCQTPNTEVLYRCRKCRRALFRSSSILSHTEGSGPTAFPHKRVTDRAQLCGAGGEKCTSYFTEPVQWMEPALLGVMEGQLLCPKCTSKLGSFSWRGEQCSCGRWVTPAFQIHKSRVDEARTLPVGNFQAAKA
ncbi:DUS12 phosphatase, partial [Rhynochetos jubatus]|nr:DUS12 phosphatase [Rhynochetos jubatus]